MRANPPPEAPIEVRRVRPSDQVALRAFYAGLSQESRRARFLGFGAGLSEQQSLSFCAPDHQHAEGFVAVHEGRLVGHLCLEPCADDRLELAVAVADDHQGAGIGRQLFEAALAWARGHGCKAIVATAYADNYRVLRLLGSSEHRPIVRSPDAGVVSVTLPLSDQLPQPWRRLTGSGPARSGRAATGRCRVVWRQRRPPVRDAAG